jgi:hypothetical protein
VISQNPQANKTKGKKAIARLKRPNDRIIAEPETFPKSDILSELIGRKTGSGGGTG